MLFYYIHYKPYFPHEGPYVNSGIHIEGILEQYAYIQQCLETGEIPERDYTLLFSDSKIDTLYQRDELNKSETLRYEKRQKQIAEGKTKINKQIEKGDWQCNFCNYKNICYDKQSKPKEIST